MPRITATITPTPKPTPKPSRHSRRRQAALLALGLISMLNSTASQAQSCSVRSGTQTTQLVELYTSEGCNSCPPADRFLSSLKGRSDVLAVAFHVDYWDYIGWKDRFASPTYTRRQQQSLAYSGARYAYTPQLMLDGRDWRSASLPPPSKVPAAVNLGLTRLTPERVALDLEALSGAPKRVALWWAMVEDGHVSQVKAGENKGVTLQHDSVVRDYASLPEWESRNAKLRLEFPISANAEPGHPRRLIVVASDAATGRVLQALQLGC